MRKLLLIILFTFLGLQAVSQLDYFLYIQSDEHQAFYARVSNKIYSSSESGYLIIPKLQDSSYQITIGFARNLYPEQIFTVAINKSDKGFELKRSGEKAWVLVNLQNKTTIPGTGLETAPNEEFSGTRKTDAFSQMLSNVVNDSSILYTAVASVEPVKKKKADPVAKPGPATATEAAVPGVQPAVPTDSLTAGTATAVTENKNLPVISPDKTNPVPEQAVTNNIGKDTARNATEALEKPFIIKLEEVTTPFQYMATYLEQYNYKTDTIRIIIPLRETPVTAPVATTSTNTPLPGSQQTVPTTITTPSSTPADSGSIEKKPAVVLVNSDCKNIASEHDVDKLRIKLLADEAVDDKLVTAKKYFKNKCFTVKQIRALSELFPTDETRYRFFDTSYPFVSDTANVYQLEDTIQNDYYKNRFKAMIHK